MKKKAIEGVKNAAERVRQEKQMVRYDIFELCAISILI